MFVISTAAAAAFHTRHGSQWTNGMYWAESFRTPRIHRCVACVYVSISIAWPNAEQQQQPPPQQWNRARARPPETAAAQDVWGVFAFPLCFSHSISTLVCVCRWSLCMCARLFARAEYPKFSVIWCRSKGIYIGTNIIYVIVVRIVPCRVVLSNGMAGTMVGVVCVLALLLLTLCTFVYSYIRSRCVSAMHRSPVEQTLVMVSFARMRMCDKKAETFQRMELRICDQNSVVLFCENCVWRSIHFWVIRLIRWDTDDGSPAVRCAHIQMSKWNRNSGELSCFKDVSLYAPFRPLLL